MTMVEVKTKAEARSKKFDRATGAGIRNGKLTGNRRYALVDFVRKEISKQKGDKELGLWVTGQYVYVWYHNDDGTAKIAKDISTRALDYLKTLDK